MKKALKVLSLSVLILFFVSCIQKKDNKKQITQRIQYDVTINNDDPNQNWYIQNLEGPARETLIKNIFAAAYKGNIKIYNADFKTITPDQLKSSLVRVDSVQLVKPTPPYDVYDTIIRSEVDLNNIKRIRFIEEWWMDENTLQFEKKIVGISPILEKYGPEGELRGYMPLFYIFLDKEYPAKMQLTK